MKRAVVKRTVSGVIAHAAELDILSLSSGAPCPPVWEENSSLMLMIPLIVGPRMGLITLTLAVFLNLTLVGLPRCCFFKNSYRTGACGMMASKSSLLNLPECWLPWVASTNPGLPFIGVRVSWWDFGILPCSVSEGLFGTGFRWLPVLISCLSGYPV